ncbi:von Willebrand factor type A domain-containing protein [Terricaulis sp.]|uniref:vWA domain-containing protein n=1 Tax=Terricaulis sp. TaxID=2768686 RepID=UPI003783FD10
MRHALKNARGLVCAIILASCAQSQQQTTTEQQQAEQLELTATLGTDQLLNEQPQIMPSQRAPSSDEEESIVVTGTRLQRQDYEAISPVTTIGGETRGLAPQASPQPAPGAIDRENYENVEVNPIHQVSADPVSTFSIDVDTASYSNVRRFITEGRLPPRDAVRIEELINYFDYGYPLPRNRQQPFSTTVSVVPSPWAEGRQLVHIGLQGYDLPRTGERPPLNLVLLIDVSGSMDEPEKLPLAIQSFRMLAEQLTARDRLSIAVYAGRAGAVLEPTSGADRAAINGALDRLHAGGSTAGGEGLRLAYALAERNFNPHAINRVIIATDGDFNVGITNPSELQGFIERKRESGIYLSVLGFGGGNYNDALMQRLAQNGNGVAAYIDTVAEARRVLSDEMTGTLFPIANDVKIQVEFNPDRVAEYRLIGYETRMLRREDFNNDAVDAGEIGAGASVTAIYEITPVGGRTFNDPLRYQPSVGPQRDARGELAFLRIRYKLPGQDDSRLIERPITAADFSPEVTRAPESTRWATAVAGYGQLLRGDPYLDRRFTWASVVSLAQTARGRDQYGWRSEFIQLARSAQTAAALPEERRMGMR